jgi:hypothetical protein
MKSMDRKNGPHNDKEPLDPVTRTAGHQSCLNPRNTETRKRKCGIASDSKTKQRIMSEISKNFVGIS